MRRVVHQPRYRRWGCAAGALLTLAVAALAPAGGAAQAQAQMTELARGRAEPPAEELMFRINEVPLPAGQPAVTQAHASGFDYSVEGTEVLTAGGMRHVVSPGQATWIGEQEEHTHGALDGAGLRFWVLAVRPASTRGAPPTWPYPEPRIRSESEGFRLGASGPHDLVLSEVRLPAPGATIGPLARSGPVGVTVVAGDVRFGGQAIASEDVVVQHPGDARIFANSGPGPARLLVLAVMPVGVAPAQLPRTGGPPPMLPVALTAAAGLLVLGVARRRSRRST